MLYYGIDFTEETLETFFALHFTPEPGQSLLLNPLYASPVPTPVRDQTPPIRTASD